MLHDICLIKNERKIERWRRWKMTDALTTSIILPNGTINYRNSKQNLCLLIRNSKTIILI